MRTTLGVLALATLVPAVPLSLACGGPPPPRPRRQFIVEYQAHGPVIDGEDLWFTIVRSQGGTDSRVFAVRCPRSAISAASAECEWHAIPERAPESATPRAIARRTAATDHECELERVTVASEHEGGVWLSVCGTQRFYRREGAGFIEQPGAPSP